MNLRGELSPAFEHEKLHQIHCKRDHAWVAGWAQDGRNTQHLLNASFVAVRTSVCGRIYCGESFGAADNKTIAKLTAEILSRWEQESPADRLARELL